MCESKVNSYGIGSPCVSLERFGVSVPSTRSIADDNLRVKHLISHSSVEAEAQSAIH